MKPASSWRFVISGKAAITTLLSPHSSTHLPTLVVQEGRLLGLTGLDQTGSIEIFIPPIAFAILFGLSMDCDVFLMSRIREEHPQGVGRARRDRTDCPCLPR